MEYVRYYWWIKNESSDMEQEQITMLSVRNTMTELEFLKEKFPNHDRFELWRSFELDRDFRKHDILLVYYNRNKDGNSNSCSM